MTVHYCDICGEEIEEYEITKVRIETPIETRCLANNDEEWDLCPKCAGKVRDFLIDSRSE